MSVHDAVPIRMCPTHQCYPIGTTVGQWSVPSRQAAAARCSAAAQRSLRSASSTSSADISRRPDATTRKNDAARSSADVELAPVCPGQHGVGERPHRGRVGVVGDTGDHLVDRRVRPAGPVHPGDGLALPLGPGAQQVERPQRPGQRVGRRVLPQLRQRVQADGLGQRDQPGGLRAGLAPAGVDQRGGGGVRQLQPGQRVGVGARPRRTTRRGRRAEGARGGAPARARGLLLSGCSKPRSPGGRGRVPW